ncbi:MAG: hypothetical protein DRI77_11890 [Chloroflexi bacterium]|nr:MAG: hypothetical protein DRI77_11890 [Chloroflexota bacterium]
MGVPENQAEFVRFVADDLTIYVARELLEKLEPGAEKQPFYLDGYGRFWIDLAEPWEGLSDHHG